MTDTLESLRVARKQNYDAALDLIVRYDAALEAAERERRIALQNTAKAIGDKDRLEHELETVATQRGGFQQALQNHAVTVERLTAHVAALREALADFTSGGDWDAEDRTVRRARRVLEETQA